MVTMLETECHLSWGSWTSLESGMVSFTKNWEFKELPQLYFGSDRKRIGSIERTDPVWYGLHSGYYRVRDKIRFVLRVDHLNGISWKTDGMYVAGSFNGWDAAIGQGKWQLQSKRLGGEAVLCLDAPYALFSGDNHFTFKFVSGQRKWVEVSPDAPNGELDGSGVRNYLLNPQRTGEHLFNFKTPSPMPSVDSYELYFKRDGREESITLRPGVFLKQLTSDKELGAVVEKDRTLFRVFAPRASEVNLYLYSELTTNKVEPISLERAKDFVWEVEVEGDRHGWFYHYRIEGEEIHGSSYFDGEFNVLDPYAQAAVGPLGPGIVIRKDTYEASRPAPFKGPAWHDLVIAEAHVRDLTAYAPIEATGDERLGYRGLKKWVKDKHFYLKQLGVNAVELQPLQLFDAPTKEEYAWGYMPVNYFSPTSHFAKDSISYSMIQETQELVQAFHEEGFAVILDVVYNHVGNPNYLQYIDKEYYFLINGDGFYENFSGCGNTIDANSPMARRLMRDSLIHWMEVYGIDGFRFDLGELIGKETLAWLEAELKQVKPEVVLVVEPWSFRAHIGPNLKDTGIASWNDQFRETVKDYVCGLAEPESLDYVMRGSHPHLTRFPAQTFNYVESHDDRCWIDKITENKNHDGSQPTALDRRRTHLMAGLLMMSTGVPMLSAGMDFLKSKQGVNNTYLRGDLNAIPYGRGAVYSATMLYFQQWVRFRLSKLGELVRLDGFPLEGYYQSFFEEKAYGLLLNANGGKGTRRLFLAVNPMGHEVRLQTEGLNLETAILLADSERFNAEGIPFPAYHVEGEILHLPAFSLGLWVC